MTITHIIRHGDIIITRSVMIKNKRMVTKQLLARFHTVILHLICMETQFGPITLLPSL